jgi:membrane protein
MSWNVGERCSICATRGENSAREPSVVTGHSSVGTVLGCNRMKPTTVTDQRRARLWRNVRQVLKESCVQFYNEDYLTVSASIAYYSLLSLFPFLLLVLGLSGIYIRQHNLAGRLAVVLEPVLPMSPDFILENLQGISQAYGRVGTASFLLLLWSSAGVFVPVEKSLNRAWGVAEGRTWIHRRLLALEMSLIFGLVLLATTALVGARGYVRDWVHYWLPEATGFFTGVAYRGLLGLASFALMLAMFMILFKTLPKRHMRLREVFPSAFLTALVWQLARSAFTLLLPRFNYRHVYGSIGVVVSLMTWAYASSALMIFGARVSAALYRTFEREAAAQAVAQATAFKGGGA